MAQYLVDLECHFSWQAQHFVKFWEIAGARNVVFFHTKCVSKMRRVRSPKRRVRIFGLSSNRLYIGGSNSGIARSNLEIRISWQAHYLVRFEGDFTCSAHCKWRFICEGLQSWKWFLVAGAVLGGLGASLFVQVQHFVKFWEISGAWSCIFAYKMRLQDGTSKVSEAAGTRWRFNARIIFGLSSDHGRIVFILAEVI